MVKKILFVCYGLGIGGIEKCLVNLINVLPEEQFEIDILLMNPEFDLKDQIVRKVYFVDRFQYVMNTTDTMKEIRQHGGMIKNICKSIRYCGFRFSVKSHGDAWKWFKKLKKQYDIAIAYSHHDYTPFYVIDKVSANRKVIWYHNGKYEKNGKAFFRDIKYFNLFDYIVAVSSDCADVLVNKFRDEKDKIIVLRNICNDDEILQKAREFTPEGFAENGVHIVTVGRLTKEKGANIAIEVCRMLLEEHCNIYWHWVGDGNQRNTIEELIAKYGLQNRFVLEGKQNNPYPYIDKCDIYVQPSYYEAYSTTITEAKVLKKPIVTTDVGGMRDQLTDEKNAYIVPLNTNQMTDRLVKLIQDVKLREKFKNELANNGIDNQRSLAEYYNTVLR